MENNIIYKCKKCTLEKTIDQMAKDSSRARGFKLICKNCEKDRVKLSSFKKKNKLEKPDTKEQLFDKEFNRKYGIIEVEQAKIENSLQIINKILNELNDSIKDSK